MTITMFVCVCVYCIYTVLSYTGRNIDDQIYKASVYNCLNQVFFVFISKKYTFGSTLQKNNVMLNNLYFSPHYFVKVI